MKFFFISTVYFDSKGTGDLNIQVEVPRILLQKRYDIQDYILYDDTSTDKTSHFTPILCEGGTTPTITFEAEHYVLSGGSKTTSFGILDLTLPTNCEITCECIPVSTVFSGAIGLAIIKNTGNAWGFIGYSNGASRVVEYRNSSWVESSSTYNLSTIRDSVIALKIVKQNTTFTFKGNNSDIVRTISEYDYVGFMKGTGTLTVKKLSIKPL